MKGIFWNSRGLSDLAKTRFLSETSKEQDLAFIALLETGKKEFSQDTLSNFSVALDGAPWAFRGHPSGCESGCVGCW
jgi:hypothetical protein